jgi:hypothetical protein
VTTIRRRLRRTCSIWMAFGRGHPRSWRNGAPGARRLRGCLNLFASVRIYFRYLVTAEAWILCLVSVASTLFFTMFEVKGRRLAVNVSWAFISFAIIFPLTNSLNETFRRRERALECIADVKAYLLSYYQAHRDWDWGENGRGKLPRNHVANVRLVLASCVADMRDVLTAPPTTRQIHYHTEWGRKERERVENMSHDMIFRISTYFDRMSLAVEELKYAGQPGNEASRMRQYVTLSMRAWRSPEFTYSCTHGSGDRTTRIWWTGWWSTVPETTRASGRWSAPPFTPAPSPS